MSSDFAASEKRRRLQSLATRQAPAAIQRQIDSFDADLTELDCQRVFAPDAKARADVTRRIVLLLDQMTTFSNAGYC